MEEWTEEQRLRFLLDVANGTLSRHADSLFLLERFLVCLEHKLADENQALDRYELLKDSGAALCMAQQLLKTTDEVRKGMALQADELSKYFIH